MTTEYRSPRMQTLGSARRSVARFLDLEGTQQHGSSLALSTYVAADSSYFADLHQALPGYERIAVVATAETDRLHSQHPSQVVQTSSKAQPVMSLSFLSLAMAHSYSAPSEWGRRRSRWNSSRSQAAAPLPEGSPAEQAADLGDMPPLRPARDQY